MATTTARLGLPRPEASDNVSLANEQALIDAIDANAASRDDLDNINPTTIGAETPTGAQAKVNTHASSSAAHNAGQITLSVPGVSATNVNAGISELFQNVSSGKTTLAAAITDMGQSALGSMTFAQLAAAIRDISDDANAAAGDVESGKTFYQGGVKRTGTLSLSGNATDTQVLSGRTYYNNSLKTRRTGTMPNRSGHVTGQSVSRSGTTVRIRPQAGYYDGSTGNSVQISDTDFVASNIRSGVNLFGLTGTMPLSQRASGTAVATAAKSWTQYDGTTRNFNEITVTGLSFKPNAIAVWGGDNSTYASIYVNNLGLIDTPEVVNIVLFRALSASNPVQLITARNITNTGFVMPILGLDQTYYWEAWG